MGVKQPESNVDHSPPSSANVKNEYSYISNSPARRHSKDKDNFLSTIIKEIKSWKVRQLGETAGMGEIKNAYGILAGKPKRNINT
jgi:hypothetical protein